MFRKYSLYRRHFRKSRGDVHNLLFPGQAMFSAGQNALTSGDAHRTEETLGTQKDRTNA